jgi:flagellar motility protein MotE (MotC chaperone)
VALTLQLQAADRYGNPRSMGGDMVEVFAKPREANGVTGGGRVEAVVADNADGTYAVTVALEEAAVHDLHVNVNGLSDSRSRYFLSPTLAPLRSGDCTVRGVAGETPLLCQTTDLYVQPANPIREMSGREAVVVTVHTPSGLAFNNPVKFEKGNRRFASPVYWVEPGAHSVSVSLSGKTLPGCPFLVEVRDPHGEEMDAMGKAGTTSKSIGSKGVGSKSGSKTGSKGGADGEGGKSGDGAFDADAAAAAAAAAAGSAGDPDADKRFAFGGGGLKPSKAASERAARSLAGMSSKVAAQAIGDMRPAAAGAVMASMDVTAAAAAAEAMEPSVAAAAMCSMEVHEAIACIVEMPKESRVAILESMTPEQLGALLSAMTPEDASDVLRILGTKWSILAVDNMVPGPAAAAVQMLTEERLVEMLIGISPKKAGAPLLEALEESEPGHRLAADAMTTLTNRHADRAAAHLAAMVDVAMAGTDRGVPGSGYAVARLFGDLPLTCQGLTIIRMTAKQAAYLMSWLGPDGAAKAAAAAAKAGGANGAGFCAAAAEELDAMGFAGDANDSGGSSNGSKGAKGGKGGNGGNGARGAAASLLAAMAKDDPAAASAALGAPRPFARGVRALPARPPSRGGPRERRRRPNRRRRAAGADADGEASGYDGSHGPSRLRRRRLGDASGSRRGSHGRGPGVRRGGGRRCIRRFIRRFIRHRQEARGDGRADGPFRRRAGAQRHEPRVRRGHGGVAPARPRRRDHRVRRDPRGGRGRHARRATPRRRGQGHGGVATQRRGEGGRARLLR